MDATLILKDGRLLTLERANAKTGWDTYLLVLDGERAPEPFLQTHATEFRTSLSPDRQWMAYQSDNPGRPEIYVSPVLRVRKWYPAAAVRLRIAPVRKSGGSIDVNRHATRPSARSRAQNRCV